MDVDPEVLEREAKILNPSKHIVMVRA
jgi:hypothetical protein